MSVCVPSDTFQADSPSAGEAITHLLESDFEPRRTLILSHGFDEEEVFARRGQGKIAPFLEERYGKDGLSMVIDEGSGTDDTVGLSSSVGNLELMERRCLGRRSLFLPWVRRGTWTFWYVLVGH